MRDEKDNNITTKAAWSCVALGPVPNVGFVSLCLNVDGATEPWKHALWRGKLLHEPARTITNYRAQSRLPAPASPRLPQP